MILQLVLAVLAAAVVAARPPASIPSEAPRLSLVRLPDGGIQPQAAADDRGTIHVVYFIGAPGGGDLMYARLDGTTFSAPVRVNSIPGSAIATGSVRGAHVAVGRGGRVHVAWNGSKTFGEDASKGPQMWYARLDPKSGRFDQQRDVSLTAEALDGGGSVAADRAGNVYVVWHARGEEPSEANRLVYIAHSKDDGTTFATARGEKSGTGACGCCGLRALAARDGRVDILYRAATANVHRDSTWLTLSAPAAASTPVKLHEWELRQCPMSTYALAAAPDGKLIAAWETEKQIYLSTLDAARRTFSSPVAVSGSGIRRLPSVAVNASGHRLVTWTEGTAWNRGGSVAWELFDADGRSLRSSRDAGVVPVWSLVAALARSDGSFVVIH